MQREAQPAHFYLGAANAAIDRRRAAQRTAELRPPGARPPVESAPGAYIGQVVTSDAQSPRHLSDEEFLHTLEVGFFFSGALPYLPESCSASVMHMSCSHEDLARMVQSWGDMPCIFGA